MEEDPNNSVMLNGVVEVNDLQKQILASEAAEAKKEQ